MQNPPQSNFPSFAHRKNRWTALLRNAAATSTAPTPLDAPRARPGMAYLSVVARLRSGDGSPPPLAPLPPLDWPQPAAEAFVAVMAVQTAYVLFVAGRRNGAEYLDRVIDGLSPTALRPTVNDNPEPWWASEMQILHALQSYSLLTGDAARAEKIARCTSFHLAEIQPDHATNEPWAVHAYGLHPDGNVTAETLLHAAYVQGGGGLTRAAAFIVADALFALENARRVE
jgi:hypothetical protein